MVLSLSQKWALLFLKKMELINSDFPTQLDSGGVLWIICEIVIQRRAIINDVVCTHLSVDNMVEYFRSLYGSTFGSKNGAPFFCKIVRTIWTRIIQHSSIKKMLCIVFQTVVKACTIMTVVQRTMLSWNMRLTKFASLHGSTSSSQNGLPSFCKKTWSTHFLERRNDMNLQLDFSDGYASSQFNACKTRRGNE